MFPKLGYVSNYSLHFAENSYIPQSGSLGLVWDLIFFTGN